MVVVCVDYSMVRVNIYLYTATQNQATRWKSREKKIDHLVSVINFSPHSSERAAPKEHIVLCEADENSGNSTSQKVVIRAKSVERKIQVT